MTKRGKYPPIKIGSWVFCRVMEATTCTGCQTPIPRRGEAWRMDSSSAMLRRICTKCLDSWRSAAGKITATEILRQHGKVL